MSFQPRQRSIPRPSSRLSTIAVGQRVFVNCPGSRSGSVELVDETGKIFSAIRLADGAEVEVVAWRPRVAGDAHYRVRVSSDGTDGWLPAINLRKLLIPVAAPEAPAPPATPVAGAGGTRFGQRSQAGRPLAPSAPAPARTSAAPAGGGRRFGQIFETDHAPVASTPTRPEPPAAGGGGRRFGQHN